MKHIGVHHVFEAIALVTALLSYRKLRNTYMVWFIPFLAFLLAVELSILVAYYSFGFSFTWVYNIAAPVYSIFYTYLFVNLAESQRHKNALKIITAVYVVFDCLYLTITHHWTTLHQYLLVTHFIEMMIFACLFFYQCLHDDYDMHSVKYRTGVWIAAGVLIFYSGSSICFSLFDYIARHDLQLMGQRLYRIIPQYLCIILYSCLSISFILWKRPVKTS